MGASILLLQVPSRRTGASILLGQVVEVLNCHTGGLGMLRWAELVVPQNLLARPDGSCSHQLHEDSSRCAIIGRGRSVLDNCLHIGAKHPEP